MSASPKLGPYHPLTLPQIQVFSIKEFAVWRARYIECITRLQNITSIPLNTNLDDECKEDRMREVKTTIQQAVGIMKGLVGFLEFVLKDGGIVELDEWCLREVRALTGECEFGVDVMRGCLGDTGMGMGGESERDLCRELGALRLGGRGDW